MTAVEEVKATSFSFSGLTRLHSRSDVKAYLAEVAKKGYEEVEFTIPNFQRDGLTGTERLRDHGLQFEWTGSAPQPTPLDAMCVVNKFKEGAAAAGLRYTVHLEPVKDVRNSDDPRLEQDNGRKPRPVDTVEFSPPVASSWRIRFLKQ